MTAGTVWRLARAEARARRRRSALGRHWSIVWPVAETALFVVLFGALLRLRGTTAAYLPFVFIGVYTWRVFARAVTVAADSVRTHHTLLSTFPVGVRPVVLASTGSALREAGPGLVLLLLAVVALAGPPPPEALLWLVPGLGLFAMTTAGLALLAAVGGALARDVQRVVGPALTLLMFAAPVVYPVSVVPAAWRGAFLANPMASSLTALRAALIGAPPPPPGPLLAASLVGSLLLGAGWWVSRAAEGRVREAFS